MRLGRIFFVFLQSKNLPNMTNNRQGDSYNHILNFNEYNELLRIKVYKNIKMKV